MLWFWARHFIYIKDKDDKGMMKLGRFYQNKGDKGEHLNFKWPIMKSGDGVLNEGDREKAKLRINILWH